MHKLALVVGLGILGIATSTLAADDKGPGLERFEALDADGDGQISFAEFQDAEVERLSAIDPDLDGYISLDEFINARPERGPGRGNRGDAQDNPQTEHQPDPERLAQMQQRMQELAQQRFEELDSDGDGKILLEDLQMANFNAMDRNGDGFLSARELRRRGPGMGGPGRRGPGEREPGGRGSQRGGQSPQA